MIIGVPKEVKKREYRAGLVPGSVRELVRLGHSVYIQSGLGEGIGLSDEMYENAGAQILATAQEVFEIAEMIVKVKEPMPEEWPLIRSEQIVFTYLHLAAEPDLAQALCQSGCIGIAYETVTDDHGGLPLLAPMSVVAGRLSVQVGLYFLQKHMGGNGMLLGGVAGVPAGKVVVLGGGVAGLSAARVAMGLESEVTVVDRSLSRLQELDRAYGSKLKTLYSTHDAIENAIKEADIVVGAVLLPGAAAPKLVTENMVAKMKKGSVLVDVSIDQGGCFETSKPTNHEDPVYTHEGVVHYCVTNMPSAVANTSSIALNNATLPYIIEIAEKGVERALSENQHLRNGLNVKFGSITNEAVLEALAVAA